MSQRVLTRETDVVSQEHACPECTGRVVERVGERHCTDCGLVVEADVVDPGPEWINSSSSHEPSSSRVGAPETHTRHDGGLGSDWHEDARELTVAAHPEWCRWDSKAERNLGIALGIVRRICSSVGVGEELTERSCAIYKEARTEGVHLRAGMEWVAAASVLLAVREQGLPLRLSDIEEYVEMDRETARFWPIYHATRNATSADPGVRTPMEFVGRLCSELDVPAGVRSDVEEVVAQAEEAALHVGMKPIGVAGGALYHCEPGVTQKQIADAAGVSIVTVRERWREVAEVADVG